MTFPFESIEHLLAALQNPEAARTRITAAIEQPLTSPTYLEILARAAGIVHEPEDQLTAWTDLATLVVRAPAVHARLYATLVATAFTQVLAASKPASNKGEQLGRRMIRMAEQQHNLELLEQGAPLSSLSLHEQVYVMEALEGLTPDEFATQHRSRQIDHSFKAKDWVQTISSQLRIQPAGGGQELVALFSSGVLGDPQRHIELTAVLASIVLEAGHPQDKRRQVERWLVGPTLNPARSERRMEAVVSAMSELDRFERPSIRYSLLLQFANHIRQTCGLGDRIAAHLDGDLSTMVLPRDIDPNNQRQWLAYVS